MTFLRILYLLLSIGEQQLGPEHASPASSLNTLAGLSWAQGQ
jgi:hypothetical protein